MTRQMIAVCLCCLVTSMVVGCGGEEPPGSVPDASPDAQKADDPQRYPDGQKGPITTPYDDAGTTVSDNKAHLSPFYDSLVEACIRATACDVKPYPRVSNCVSYFSSVLEPLGLAPVYDEIYRCTNRAESCADVRSCFGVTGPCDASFSARCDGGRAVFCDLLDKTTFTYDCAGAGLSCELDAQYGFAATCSGQGAPSVLTDALDCKGTVCRSTGQPCPEDALDRCDGGQLQACLGGEWVSFDCVAFGLGACQLEAGGWARCGAK